MGRSDRHQKLTNGDEYDWTHGRQWYHWNAGTGKYIKRGMARRRRKLGRQEIQRDRERLHDETDE